MRRVVVTLFVVAVTGCVTTPPEEDPVFIKLNELDGRMARFERVVSNQSLLDMAQRLDALQADVRTLRGRIEELENSNEALRKQQRDLYSDLDRRLTQAGSGAGGSVGGSEAAGGERAAYAQAFDALKASDYPAAIAGFQQFLATFPQGELADNAQYWLGEAYYVMRDYQNAAVAFNAVVRQWPASRKVPDALVKLGFSQHELKQYSAARTTLSEVMRQFPDTDAARLAGERLRRIPEAAR